MSYGSAAIPSDPLGGDWRPEGEGGLFQQLCQASRFLRDLRLQMRYGSLTRAPLQLLRFQIVGEMVECDWLSRSLDPWDADLSSHVQQRHASLQALRDAIDIRALIFRAIPGIDTAYCRAFRGGPTPEPIIAGNVHRNDHSARDVHSLVMREKVLGFRFRMEGDVLRKI